MRTSTATAILAFCATNSFAAPAPAPKGDALDPGFSLRCLDSPDLQCPAPDIKDLGWAEKRAEKRGTQIIPFVAGLRIGAAFGKKLLFDDKKKRDASIDPSFSLRCLDSPDLTCPPPGEDEFGQPQIVGKRDAVEKRQGLFGLGLRVGSALGKTFLFGDDDKKKRDAEALDIKGALTWWANEVLDDSPYNPFDDPGLPGKSKRDAAAEPQPGIKDALTWWANEVLDDSPYNPFDDPGLPGKRDADAQPAPGIKDVLTWWANEVLDDSPYNPFDDPGLPGKRDVEPLEKRQALFGLGLRVGSALGKFFLFNDKVKRDALVDDLPVVSNLDELLEKLPVVGSLDEILDKLPVVGDLDEILANLPVVGGLLDGGDDEKSKRDALVDINLPKLPVVGGLGKLPVVGDLPIVGDLLNGGDKKERNAKRFTA